MIHLVKHEQTGLPFLDSDGTEPRLIAHTGDNLYQLYSVPRFNKEHQFVENYYEVFNTNTGVIESRIKTNYVTAMSVFEAIINVYNEYTEAGSAEAMTASLEAEDAPRH